MKVDRDHRRHRVDNVAALTEVMRRDAQYAATLHYLAETDITTKLRREFYRLPSDLVLDAFNEAFLQLLQSRTFRDDAFLCNQPSAGWTSAELVSQVVGGYLYVSARNELIRLAQYFNRQHEPQPGEEAFSFDDVPDQNETSDPAKLYEQIDFFKCVQECTARLPAQDRDALWMSQDNVPIATIAERLNEKSPDNMKTRLHRIRKRVIECARRRLR